MGRHPSDNGLQWAQLSPKVPVLSFIKWLGAPFSNRDGPIPDIARIHYQKSANSSLAGRPDGGAQLCTPHCLAAVALSADMLPSLFILPCDSPCSPAQERVFRKDRAPVREGLEEGSS